jgi:hypothetical protein
LGVALASVFFYQQLFVPGVALALTTFVALYFIFHGICNEFTLYQRLESKKLSNSFYFVSASTFFIYLAALAHPSFFFRQNLDFYISSIQESKSLITSSMPFFGDGLQVFFYALLLVSTLFIAHYLWKKKYYSALFVVANLATVAAFYLFLGPPSFVLVLALLLIYHFVSWWVFFLQIFLKDKKNEALKAYLSFSAVIHVIFLLLFCLRFFEIEVAAGLLSYVFSLPIFLAVTFFHITTSFLNEQWIRNLLRLK